MFGSTVVLCKMNRDGLGQTVCPVRMRVITTRKVKQRQRKPPKQEAEEPECSHNAASFKVERENSNMKLRRLNVV